MSGPEASLVNECRQAAEAMGAFLAVVQQHVAKKAGSTRGYPDLTLICAGQTVLIEVKRPKTAEHPHGYLSLAQSAFIAAALEQGVTVHVVDNVRDFEALVNDCRKRRGVR
jgi:aspartyl/asparaginyl beta-hydroxylase (cupin superfamily)